MIKHAFITVTDGEYFEGTVAAVGCIVHFHSDSPIYVIVNQAAPLTEQEIKCFTAVPTVSVVSSADLAGSFQFVKAWALKTAAALELSKHFDVIIEIDSDCLLCSNVDAEIQHCFTTGCFLGGRDGDGKYYDRRYRNYGIDPSLNPKYMSTSYSFMPDELPFWWTAPRS